MATTKTSTPTFTFTKEKDTKRYTKYNAPEPFTGAIYVPLDPHNPDTLEVTFNLTGKPNGAS